MVRIGVGVERGIGLRRRDDNKYGCRGPEKSPLKCPLEVSQTDPASGTSLVAGHRIKGVIRQLTKNEEKTPNTPYHNNSAISSKTT